MRPYRGAFGSCGCGLVNSGHGRRRRDDRGDRADPGRTRDATACRGEPQPTEGGLCACPERRGLRRALEEAGLAVTTAEQAPLPVLHSDLLIGGRWVEALAGARRTIHDPATGELVGDVAFG